MIIVAATKCSAETDCILLFIAGVVPCMNFFIALSGMAYSATIDEDIGPG